MSVLKQIVGGDSLKGRQKYIQGSFEIRSEGMVLLVGNHPLRTTDSSNAILRRMRGKAAAVTTGTAGSL